MLRLVVRPGVPEDVDQVQFLFNSSGSKKRCRALGLCDQALEDASKTSEYLGGFTMRDSVLGAFIRGNEHYDNNVVLERDGEIIGASESISKGIHFKNLQLVTVLPEFRRQRYGTLLYSYQILRGMVEGRLLLRDQVVSGNTPMFKFCDSMRFDYEATHRIKTRGQKDLVWYNCRLIDFDKKWKSGGEFLDRWPQGDIHLVTRGFGELEDKNFRAVYGRLLEAGLDEEAQQLCRNVDWARDVFGFYGRVEG